MDERDYESHRRKFKVLYSTRKPTGVADMPPHIKEAKLLKRAIDEKANVVVMDDAADEEDRNESAEPFDLCFDYDGGEGFRLDPHADGDAAVSAYSTRIAPGSVASSQSTHHDETHGAEGDLDAGSTTTETGDSGGEFSVLLTAGTIQEGLEAFASTPPPSPIEAPGKQRLTSSARLPKAAVGPTRDQVEAQRYPKLSSACNRVGGSDLNELRDTIGRKRTHEDNGEMLEASYAKAKPMRAAKATVTLKNRLSDLENTSNSMGGNVFDMLLMMREENERRAEAHRMDEGQWRRDEAAARDARNIADKAEAEERRRPESLEMEERARRDKEEARARTQEMMLFIGALTKKD